MKIKWLGLPIGIILLLNACTTAESIQGISSTVFAAGGAYGGYRACKGQDQYTRAACVAAGGMAGAIIGNFVGSNIVSFMDRRDKQRLNSILSQRNNGNQQWRNPDTGTVFQVSNIRTHDGCKNFTLSASHTRASEQHQACRRNGRFL